MLLKMFLEGVALPGLASALCILILPRLFGSRPGLSPVIGAVSLSVGYLTGHALIIGLPRVPPLDTTQWLFVLVALSIVPALLAGAGRAVQILACVILTGILVGTTLMPMVRYHWNTLSAVWWSAALSAALLLLWYSLNRLALDSATSPLLPPFFLLLTLSAGALLLLSASALLALLAGAAAASFATLWLFGRRREIIQGWIPVALVVLGGLVLNGHFYAQLAGWSVLSLAAASLAPWVTRINWLQRRSLWWRTAATLLLVVLCTAPALLQGLADFRETPSYDDY